MGLLALSQRPNRCRDAPSFGQRSIVCGAAPSWQRLASRQRPRAVVGTLGCRATATSVVATHRSGTPGAVGGTAPPPLLGYTSLIVGNAPLITRYHFGVDFPPPAPVTARVSSQRSRAVLVTPSVPTTPVGRCGDDRASRNGGQRCRNASFWDAGTPLGGRRHDILAADSINPSPNVTNLWKGSHASNG